MFSVNIVGVAVVMAYAGALEFDDCFEIQQKLYFKDIQKKLVS